MDKREREDKAKVSLTSQGNMEGTVEKGKGKVESRTTGQMEPPPLPPEAVKPEGYDEALVSTQWELARGAETLKANQEAGGPPPEPEVPASTDITAVSVASPAVVTVVDGAVLAAATGIVISGTGNAALDKAFATGEYTLAGNDITLSAVDNSLGTTHTGLVTASA